MDFFFYSLHFAIDGVLVKDKNMIILEMNNDGDGHKQLYYRRTFDEIVLFQVDVCSDEIFIAILDRKQ